MFEALTSYHLIIIFSITIIISYFFNLYAKKTGIPAVLLLIFLGIIINYSLRIVGYSKTDLLHFAMRQFDTLQLNYFSYHQ